MKKSKILSLNLEEEITKSQDLTENGGNYEEGNEPQSSTESTVRYFVNDMTAERLFGPYFSFETAEEVARRRQEKFPTHNIIIQQVSGEDAAAIEANDASELALRFWVLHYEKDRRYGPYYSFGTAQGVMIRKKSEYPGDRFDIEEEEFEPSMINATETDTAGINVADSINSQQVISVRVYFTAQGLGSFRAGRFNTSNGDSSGWFRAGSSIALSAIAASGHKFSHWTFDGNFGGNQASRTVRAKRGMKIVGVFAPA